MTVKELIDKLSEIPENADVEVDGYFSPYLLGESEITYDNIYNVLTIEININK